MVRTWYLETMDTQNSLTIGRLAAQTGVGVETIRFYERKGLIQKPVKRGSGYRQYSNDDPRKVHFIRRAQDLGFTLREIKELLEMDAKAGVSCAAVKPKTRAKLEEVEGKIEDLKRMRDALKRLQTCCGLDVGKDDHCRILDCFQSGCSCCQVSKRPTRRKGAGR
jgi:MerR family mercuric resistance operon transcriptional regulator